MPQISKICGLPFYYLYRGRESNPYERFGSQDFRTSTVFTATAFAALGSGLSLYLIMETMS